MLPCAVSEPSAVDDAPNGSSAEEKPSSWAMGLAILFVLGLVALMALVLYRIYPTHIHPKTNPGFIDNIFGTNLVVFASRVVLLSAALVLAFVAVYTVVSVFSWMKQRQWLAKAGPFEVSREAIEGLEGLVQFWQDEAADRAQEVEQLSEQLQRSNELLGVFLEEPSSQEGLGEIPGTDNVEGDDESSTSTES
jgi:hypothetical protein